MSTIDTTNVMKMALEAFDSMVGRKPERVEQAITALRVALASQGEALAEQPAPVPIGNRPREEDYTKLTSYIEALETYVDKKEQQWKAFEDYDCDAIDAMLAEKKALAEQPAQQEKNSD